MSLHGKCGSIAGSGKDEGSASTFVSLPTTTSNHHHHHLAAIAAGSHNYPPVDHHNAAFMISNAAATIAAVATSAVQQMTQAKAPCGTGLTEARRASSVLTPPLYHAALQQGNHNSLISRATGAQQVQPHAALLTALANAGQPSSVQAIASTPSVPGHTESTTTASSVLRPSAPVLSQQPTSSLASPALLSDMQSWNLEQLDQRIAILHQMNQPVPHSIAILRSEAERKIKKKNDKRLANRKSASNSRARKKALVEEMTKTNARLKKQAMILALLPDLVMTTSTEGDITFCSAQAERILGYKTEDLTGARLYNLLVPSSRRSLKSLIEDLVNPGKAKAARACAAAQARRNTKRTVGKQRNSDDANATSKRLLNANGNSNASIRDSSRNGGNSTDDTSGAAIVSEQSFPLSVVEVESKQPSRQEDQRTCTEPIENSDLFTSNSGGKLLVLLIIVSYFRCSDYVFTVLIFF
jgi:PAS domain-containing protein